MTRTVLLFCPSLKMLFKYQSTDRVSMLTCTLTVSLFKFNSKFILSTVCVCVHVQVGVWRRGRAAGRSLQPGPGHPEEDGTVWRERLGLWPPPPPLPPFPRPDLCCSPSVCCCSCCCASASFSGRRRRPRRSGGSTRVEQRKVETGHSRSPAVSTDC